MSDFSDAMEEGFGEALDEAGTPIKVGNLTRSCIVGPLLISRDMRDSGYLAQCTATAMISRSDATALGITDRTPCLIGGKRMKPVQIEDDPSDPSTLLLHLKPERV